MRVLDKLMAPVARLIGLPTRRERQGDGFDPQLLDVLACPATHGPLRCEALSGDLVSDQAGRTYPVADGIPILLVDAPPGPPPSPSLGERAGRDVTAMGFVERYDAAVDSPPMRALYGDSGHFNVGYWADGVETLVEACDRLVDELARLIPPDAKLIVDAGCGVGAATIRLAGRFPEARVLGTNISHWQLVQAKRHGLAAAAVMDAARLGIASGVADAVFALQAAMLFDTRAAFLAEAHRVLRPGGALVLTDMLFNDPEPAGTWMLPPANAIASIPDYEDKLAAAGFEAIEVRDATDLCWRPFCALLRTVYPGREEMVATLEASVSNYLLVSARKP